MFLDIISSYFQSISLLTVGILMGISKEEKEWNKGFRKYWFYFILLGVILFLYEFFKSK